MKTIYITIILFALSITALNAQNVEHDKGFSTFDEIPTVYITDNVTLHFRSPEKIDYVDISNDRFIGGLATETIFRIKLKNNIPDSVKLNMDYEPAMITIVGKSFMAQYRLIYLHNRTNVHSEHEVLPQHMKAIEKDKSELSFYELNKICYHIYDKSASYRNVKSKKLNLEILLNNIYTRGNYIFLDVSFKNKTKIKFDIDQVEFFIEDKKINKQTNFQSILFNPTYVFDKRKEFKKEFRNIYVFDKFTYPNNKVFRIRITEKQVSGRNIDLFLDYNDLLNADTI